MIAGLHWTAWLLMAVSVGLGLTVELLFFARQRRAIAERKRGEGGDRARPKADDSRREEES